MQHQLSKMPPRTLTGVSVIHNARALGADSTREHLRRRAVGVLVAGDAGARRHASRRQVGRDVVSGSRGRKTAVVRNNYNVSDVMFNSRKS